MNRSAEQTNRGNREKKIAVHAICLFRTAIRIISHEPRKKTLIPYIYNASNKDPF